MPLPRSLALALVTALAASSVFASNAVLAAEGPPAPAAIERLLLMSVDGRIVIEADGSVGSYTPTTELQPAVAAPLARLIQAWRFEPVLIDGAARRVEARMRVSLAAVKDGEDYQVHVENAVFPEDPQAADTDRSAHAPRITANSRRVAPPSYPHGLAKAGVGGRVLVALHFSPEGQVLEVVPVQTMLFDTRGNDALMASAIAQFESATVEAAKRWRVNLSPRPGVIATAKDYTAYTTVEYVSTPQAFGQRHRMPIEPVGEWRAVVRNGKRPLPWLSGLGTPDVGVADVDNGETLPLAGAPQLKAPVAGAAL